MTTQGGSQFSGTNYGDGTVQVGNIYFTNEEARKRLDDRDCRDCLQALRGSSGIYEEQKNTNPPREPGTCQWFLEHPRFVNWRDNSTSVLLWVTADPGCGKSVLSRALVDEQLLDDGTETTTICYYFFKDISDSLHSATRALASMLHQLFSKNNSALIKHGLPVWNENGNKMTSSFDIMWDIIKNVAADPESRNIVFLFDALDECRRESQKRLIECLKQPDSIRATAKHSVFPRVRFLATSRPYWDIEKEFIGLTKDIPSIELRGEEESESIHKEIDLVIKAQVSRLPIDIFVPHEARNLLIQQLLGVENRTYLWLHLILELIQEEPRIDDSMIEGLSGIPDTLEKAYEKILQKSINREKAIKLLHIVVGTARPLTLAELQIALYIKDGMRSYKDLQPQLQAESMFKITIRNLCGLFVSVVDCKVYLIHQTAKEFLVATSSFQSDSWKFSLKPIESNLILAKICMSYLLLSDSEDHTVFNVIACDAGQPHLLDYASKFWISHFKATDIEDYPILLEMAFQLCDSRHGQFTTWTKVLSNPLKFNSDHPVLKDFTELNLDHQNLEGFTELMIASYFGLVPMLPRILMDKSTLHAKDRMDRTALYWAAERGNVSVACKLLMAGSDVNAIDKYGYTPLMMAVESGNRELVQLLLDNEADTEVVNKKYGTALMIAEGEGNPEVVRLLLDCGAKMDTKGMGGQSALWFSVNTRLISNMPERTLWQDLERRFRQGSMLHSETRGEI